MITTILSYHIVNIKVVKKLKFKTYNSDTDVTIGDWREDLPKFYTTWGSRIKQCGVGQLA